MHGGGTSLCLPGSCSQLPPQHQAAGGSSELRNWRQTNLEIDCRCAAALLLWQAASQLPAAALFIRRRRRRGRCASGR